MASYNQLQIRDLQAERTDDPLGLGYSGMTDQQFTDSLNALTRTRPNPVSAGDIFEEVVGTELPSAGTQDADTFGWVLTAASSRPVTLTGNILEALKRVFGPPTSTRANLAAIQFEAITRLTELRLPSPIELEQTKRTT